MVWRSRNAENTPPGFLRLRPNSSSLLNRILNWVLARLFGRVLSMKALKRSSTDTQVAMSLHGHVGLQAPHLQPPPYVWSHQVSHQLLAKLPGVWHNASVLYQADGPGIDSGCVQHVGKGGHGPSPGLDADGLGHHQLVHAITTTHPIVIPCQHSRLLLAVLRFAQNWDGCCHRHDISGPRLGVGDPAVDSLLPTHLEQRHVVPLLPVLNRLEGGRKSLAVGVQCSDNCHVELSQKSVGQVRRGVEPVCCQVPSLHFILGSVAPESLDNCFLDSLNVVLGGCQSGPSSVDVASVRVGPDGIVQALVEEAVLRWLGLHVLFERKTTAPVCVQSLVEAELGATLQGFSAGLKQK